MNIHAVIWHKMESRWMLLEWEGFSSWIITSESHCNRKL